MLATMDYSGWERWIEDVRSAFPRAAFSPPRRPKSLVPAFIDPTDIGYAPQFGQVGSAAGRRRLAEELSAMGIDLAEADLGAVYSLVLNLAERKRVLYPEDLRLAADEALGRAAPGRFALVEFQVHAESGVSSSATVSLEIDGELRSASASGSGSLDAAFRAVQEITGLAPELEDFSLAAATRGSDALGEAVVTLSQESRVVLGKAVSVDVLEAAVKAYVNALNWLVRDERGVAPASTAATASS
jgi:2-isopropylmalate synthase